MKKLFKWLFPTRKLVWVTTGQWNIFYTKNKSYNEYAYYEIYKINDEYYKLRISGFDPKAHHLYPKVIEKLNELIDEN